MVRLVDAEVIDAEVIDTEVVSSETHKEPAEEQTHHGLKPPRDLWNSFIAGIAEGVRRGLR